MCLIRPTLAAAFLASILVSGVGMAAGEDYVLAIKNHRFEPAELTIPANQAVKLTIDNQDDTPEEFESRDLQVEKVVLGGSKITVRVGPMPAGEYKFFGEFHEDTAQGKLIVE